MSDSCDHMECNLPGSSVHGLSQTRTLERVAISFSRGSSQLKEPTHISCITNRFFTTEPPGKPCYAIGPCYPFYVEWFASANLPLLYPPSPLLTMLVFYVYRSVLSIGSLVSYFRFHIKVISYGICLSDLYHLV